MKRFLTYIILIMLLVPKAMASEAYYVSSPKDGDKERLKVALVLGGGGAKGAAEIGVLKYIEEADIPIDYIVGTSIGSIVGGLYSVGYRSAQLDSIFRSQEWLSLLTDRKEKSKQKLIEKEDGVVYVMGFPLNFNLFMKRPDKKFHLGALRGDSIVSTLEKMTCIKDSVNFDSLPIPFRCVSVDLNTFEEVVLSKGSLAKAMRASMAIPLAFRPMVIDNRTLVDGGLLNNLPVDVAKAMGADVVIAVDLSVSQKTEDSDGYVADDLGGIFEPLKKLGLLTMLKWSVVRPDIKRYKVNKSMADVYIHPRLKGYDAADFVPHRIAEMIALGEKEGERSVKDLKKLRKRIMKGKK